MLSQPIPGSVPPDLVHIENCTEIDIQSREIKYASSSAIISQVLGNLCVKPPILELGSGTGALYRLLPDDYRPGYIGIDKKESFQMFNHADNPLALLVRGSIYNLPIATASRDTVVSLNVADMLPNLAAAVSEIRNVLSPAGIFLHLHDRRPNLGFLLRHLPEGFIAFPELNESGAFDRFRLVSRTEYGQAPLTAQEDLSGYISLAENSPDQLEIAEAFAPGVMSVISARVKKHFGNTEDNHPHVTPSFKDLFNAILGDSLMGQGLELLMSENLQARVLIREDELESFIKHKPIRPTYKDGNLFTIDKNGYYSFSQNQLDLPKGYSMLQTGMSVVAARKVND